jgi:hypothetical protein
MPQRASLRACSRAHLACALMRGLRRSDRCGDGPSRAAHRQGGLRGGHRGRHGPSLGAHLALPGQRHHHGAWLRRLCCCDERACNDAPRRLAFDVVTPHPRIAVRADATATHIRRRCRRWATRRASRAAASFSSTRS